MEVSDIKDVKGKMELIVFLGALAANFRDEKDEWKNVSVDKFIEACAAYIMTASNDPKSGVDWGKLDYKAIAKIFYMGKGDK